MKEKEKNLSKVKGGIARAKALSKAEMSEIAKKGAEARWGLPVATHEGFLKLGNLNVACANLEDGRRIITQAAFLRALGRSRSPKAGTGVLTNVDPLPVFLQA